MDCFWSDTNWRALKRDTPWHIEERRRKDNERIIRALWDSYQQECGAKTHVLMRPVLPEWQHVNPKYNSDWKMVFKTPTIVCIFCSPPCGMCALTFCTTASAHCTSACVLFPIACLSASVNTSSPVTVMPEISRVEFSRAPNVSGWFPKKLASRKMKYLSWLVSEKACKDTRTRVRKGWGWVSQQIDRHYLLCLGKNWKERRPESCKC